MKIYRRLLAMISAMLCLAGCRQGVDDWSSSDAWFEGSLTPDSSKVDVFYLVSTNVVSARDTEGQVSMRSLLSEEDMKYINLELNFVKDSIFHDEFNFISPYYHQYTFESFVNYPSEVESVHEDVGKEVCEAFDWYMKNVNNGRPFILAGFSQGGEMTMDILRHMTEKQHAQMVAAYVIGYKVTSSDTLKYASIKPAKGETDTGVTVSFNSVLDTDGIWDFVSGGTVACINPVNWAVDTTSATFTYRGSIHKVHCDPDNHVLIVDTDPEPYRAWMSETPPFSTSGISQDCLHHWDIQFYTHQIHDNAVKRAMIKRQDGGR